MPTQPITSVIDRDYATNTNQEIHKLASNLLQEVVNYSSHIFYFCLEKSANSDKYKENVKLAPFCLYIHAIEMVDAAEVLISNSCVTAVIPLLRSHFEAYISLKFMLKEQLERRSLAWLIHSKIDLQKFHNLFDDTTESGREFTELFIKTIHQSDKHFLVFKGKIQSSVANTQKFLSRPEIAPIASEVRHTKKWYSIDNGPRNIQQLAEYVDLGVYYSILYGQWSAYSHNTDPIRFLRTISPNSSYHSILRIDDELSQMINLLVSFQIEMSKLIINEFNPTMDIRQWYITEVGDLFRPFFEKH